MTGSNLPLSEQFRIMAMEWVDLEAAAQLLEDTKSLIMAQKQAALGDLPVNRSEQIIKATPEWYEHIEKIVTARKEANAAKMEMEYLKMRFSENQSHEATNRLEMKMVG